MPMQLKSFRITQFRSVDDSGVIETDGVTALIGINESGKSNLLVPLWKMRPAKDGEIKPTADYPRKSYNDIRSMDDKPVFAAATFTPTEEQANRLARMAKSAASAFEEIEIQRTFSGKAYVSFPKAPTFRTIERERVVSILSPAVRELNTLTPLKSEEDACSKMRGAAADALATIGDETELDSEFVKTIVEKLPAIEGAAKTSAVGPRYGQLRSELQAVVDELSQPLPNEMADVRNAAYKEIPAFVYYTNYGNLDSEIYLPHVIDNMGREDLGPKEQAKVRTLKVLFEFVGLQPQEILELGRDFKPTNAKSVPTDDEISEIAEKKKERSILLQSASTKLTREFREWWRQGEYRFRFEADGDHFRIWVSDDKRPEEVELEGRSTGLQWFLSFYLVFLVESRDAHEGAILLLDEPGTSLHPLAQKDLSMFFDSLSEKNQLIYTTHSPFLIDPDRLDRARKVYVAGDGTTRATADLKEAEGDDKALKASGYAVYAALGLTVAESLLLGCTTVVVEGVSDLIYLSAIKSILIGLGKIRPSREIVFPPAGGAKGVKVVASILTGRDEALPIVLFDDDKMGRQIAQQLKDSIYAESTERVLNVRRYTDLESSEIEDLIPPEMIALVVDRWQRGPEQAFSDAVQEGKPMVPQIESWASANKITLITPAWKVELAKRVKQTMLGKNSKQPPDVFLEKWERLFEDLLQ